MSFAEAGLLPRSDSAPRGASPLARSNASGRLERATENLLAAIEAETGVRLEPEGDGELASHPYYSHRGRRTGWSSERAQLATELIRAIDTHSASRRSVSRAHALLQWDRRVGTYRSEVDELLVNDALARADAVLGHPSAPAEPPVTVEFRAFDWPISPVRITSPYGARLDPLGEGIRHHAGIDLAAHEGQSVYAATDGVVTFAGLRGGYGLHVEVRHQGGVVTRYAHLSELRVRRGMRVARGQPVGRAGSTGRTTGPHLHFELWRDGVAVDPALEIDGRASRVVTDIRRAGGPSGAGVDQ